MKNKLTKIIAVLMVAGAMFSGPVAHAVSRGDGPQSGQGDKRGTGRGSMQDPMAELNLTPSQQAEVMALRNSAEQEKKRAEADAIRKMKALDAAIAEPETTLTDVSDLIEETGEFQARALSLRTKYLFAMKKILTPEQFEQMQKQQRSDKKTRQINKGSGSPEGQSRRSDPKGPQGENPGSDQD